MGSRLGIGCLQEGLLSIIQKLESPSVRLDDNTLYRVQMDVLGVLYARVIQTVPANVSPALMRSSRERFGVIARLQQTLQNHTREQFRHYLGQLELRRTDANGLYVAHVPTGDWPEFLDNTVEAQVRELSLESRFEDIGTRLRRGCVKYDSLKDKSQGLSREYEFILEEMSR